MQIQRQTIECVRCGLAGEDLLTEEETEKLVAAVGPIYRYCEQCATTTGWIGSESLPARMENSPLPQSRAGSGTRSPILKGQERMATQAERDHVDSMARDHRDPEPAAVSLV